MLVCVVLTDVVTELVADVVPLVVTEDVAVVVWLVRSHSRNVPTMWSVRASLIKFAASVHPVAS